MIRLDMDGIVADFVLGWERLYGCPPVYDDPSLLGIWNFPKILGPATWMQDCGEEFYANLPLMHDAHDIVDAVAEFGEFSFLTYVISPAAHAGKLRWAERHFPGIRVEGLTAKGDAAAAGHILVDDADHNVDEYIRAGGHAVLVPRIWNSLHDYRHLPAADHVRSVLARHRT